VNSDAYRISDVASDLDMDQVFGWLSHESYWAKGRARDLIERSFANSFPVGIYLAEKQVAVARLVSDGATFAWLCDVFVDSGHRGQGLGKRLAQWSVDWMEQRGIGRIVLATADAHGVYASVGFQPLSNPQRWMEIDRRPQRHDATRVEQESAYH
jgi:GNAT superfamily N-acetyltransferase